MRRGRIIGEVWSTKKAPALGGRALKLVGMVASDEVVVAIDTLDAREGQEVLVAFGSGARNVLEPGPNNRHLLADAAIALVIDGESDSHPEESV